MPRSALILLFWLCRIVFAPALAAAQNGPLVAEIPRTLRPPRLEEFVNGTPPESALKITDFRQREPGDGNPVSQETTAYLSYDDKNLYVVFVCKDEPGKTRAHLSKREAIFGDDTVAIFLDTFHDRQRAYQFSINPLGIQLDGILVEGQHNDFSFDTLWHSEGRLVDDGFIVLMAVPFRSLRFPNTASQTWGFALGRFIPRNAEYALWPYISRRIQGFASQMAVLKGLKDISPGRNLQLIPYGTFTGSRFLDRNAQEFATTREGRAGLDAKIVLRDALTLDLAANPDFSQVESDEPQVTVNQRFEVFFPEKRPFFLENAGFFRTPENLFFSRRVVDPELGARLTGKLGRWAMGAMAIDDRAPGKRLEKNDLLHGDHAVVGVFRLQREFGEQSNLGFMITDRHFGPASNQVFSLDTRLKLNQNWSFRGQLAQSHTARSEEEDTSGLLYLAGLTHEGRNFNYEARYADRSPGFHSALGFIRRVDVRQFEQFFGYRWRPAGGRVNHFGPFGNMMLNWDRQNRLQDRMIEAGFSFLFAGPIGVVITHERSFELFQHRGFEQNSSGVFFFGEWLKWLNVFAHYNQGTRINYVPARGLLPFLADSVMGELTVVFRPLPQLSLDQRYIYSRLDTRTDRSVANLPSEVVIFNNHLVRWKVNYQFTRELSLRAILDYSAVLPNPSLVLLDRDQQLRGDILITYLVNPGTALYLGFSDRYENLELAAEPPHALRRTGSPTLSSGRQFFIKLSYLFRL